MKNLTSFTSKETIKNLQRPVSNFHIIKQTAIKNKHMVYLKYKKTLYHKKACPHLLYFARKRKKSNNFRSQLCKIQKKKNNNTVEQKHTWHYKKRTYGEK